MAEKKSDNSGKKFITKLKKNPWMISSVILGVIAVILIAVVLIDNSHTISKAEAEQKIIDFAKVQGVDATVTAVNSKGSVYEVLVLVDSQEVALYITKDGENLIPSLVPLSAFTGQAVADTSADTQATEVPKTDKPVVELFVMAFCPYGVQAEQGMKPVYDLLKAKVDFNIRYIVNVGGDTLESVQSLHGALEAQEDARQLCIKKYYPDKLWDYVSDIDANCYPTYRTEGALDTCWKQAANKFGILTSKIETCVNSEAVAMLKSEESISGGYGVSGSPTLIINGVKSNSGRTPDAYKQAICSAFTTAPTECDTVLSSTGQAASGNC